uniref:Uncharacterized protein n=1 Tax=Trichogramma kaykai TaxID=54128 RepID=A0ABD2W889_9HYME
MKFDVFGLPIPNSSSSPTSEKKNRLEILQPRGRPQHHSTQPTHDPYHLMNVDRLKSSLVSIEKIDVNDTGHYDAHNKRITNVAPAVEKSDAIDLSTLRSNIKSTHQEIEGLEKKINAKINAIVKFDGNGNYDMMFKKLQNVAEPVNDSDAVVLKTVRDVEKKLMESINKIPRGPPGYGYKPTPDGNFDLMQKRLTNMAHPLDDFDGVNLWTLNFYVAAIHGRAQRNIDDVYDKLQQNIVNLSRNLDETANELKTQIDSIEKKRVNLDKLLERQIHEKKLVSRNPEIHILNRD